VARTSPPALARSVLIPRLERASDTGSRSRGSWGLEESPASGLYGTVIRLVRNSEKSIEDHDRYHKWSLDQQETRKQMQRRRFRFLQDQVSKINEKEPDRTPWKSKQRARAWSDESTVCDSLSRT
jgi:hypothetical protein